VDVRADRRTDMTKLTVAFRYFANAPNRRPMTDYSVAREYYDFCQKMGYDMLCVFCEVRAEKGADL
jgi:hypothetical protein